MNYRTKIINAIVNSCDFKSYLEIGVRDADQNFNLIDATIKHSVDPNPIKDCTYKMTSDEFFSTNKHMYDIAFIDGLHTKEQSYKDVINTIKFLNDDGVIVMHDCNPTVEYHTRSYEQYLKHRGHWNGDVYKAFIQLKHELNDWNCFVINEDFGCGIITKRQLSTQFKSNSIGTVIDWTDFNTNRIAMLDLITYNDFLTIM